MIMKPPSLHLKNLLPEYIKMKNLSFIFLIIVLLGSCKKEFDNDQYPQKWKLVKMSGQLSNANTSGNDMAWQEFYLLNSNGTFTKSRERDGQQTEASGNFKIKDLSDGKYLVLNYNSISSLIGSCTSNYSETLWVRSENKMTGTWSYCDGPGLEYDRIK